VRGARQVERAPHLGERLDRLIGLDGRSPRLSEPVAQLADLQQHGENGLEIVPRGIHQREVEHRIREMLLIEITENRLREGETFQREGAEGAAAKLVGDDVGLGVDLQGFGARYPLDQSQFELQSAAAQTVGCVQ
jgi:hypothetical protein